MLIHFICTGNVYRSRLAEACLNAKQLPGVSATSSGIRASLDENGPITWFAEDILDRRGLLQFTASTWTQTDAESLAAADHIVFMMEEHRSFCEQNFLVDGRQLSVWGVPDLDIVQIPATAGPDERDALLLLAAEHTFERISALVDALVLELGYVEQLQEL
jgi:protein-tyrosine-phosphatase